MKSRLAVPFGISALLVAALLPSGAVAQSPERFGRVDTGGRQISLENLPSQKDPKRIVNVGVALAGRPVAGYIADAFDAGTTFSESQKLDVRRVLAQRQARVGTQLRTLGASVEATFTDVFNGFRIRVKADKLPEIARLSEVKDLYSVPEAFKANANTVSYLGADKTWGQTGFIGAGVKIAVIDSGINYYHRDFGGAGAAAWAADDSTIVEPGSFPTAKVVAGYDLVGDAYDGSNTPVPDPDPLDCKDVDAGTVQHGTHVSGTAAGQGVRSNGMTYNGAYDASTLNTTSFRIAPGVAPAAKLMAFRVFGCDGSTFVVVDALERAVQAGADIINMSLGSPLGNSRSMDAVATNNASLAGVTVVASAGNEGASAFVTGSPAVASRAISVAAMDAQQSFPSATIAMATGADITAINANGNTNGMPITGELNVFEDDTTTPCDSDTGEGCEESGTHHDSYVFNAYTAGQIPVTFRGNGARVDRAIQGDAEGAPAVIMVSNADAFPPYENTIPGADIPFLGVPSSDAPRFVTDEGSDATLSEAGSIANPDFKHTASFTSGGPRRGDLMLKPDVAAPGVSVFSADGGTTNQGKNLSGTSMASPATAGVAALVKSAHPNWLPRDIKAAIVGTAAADKMVPYDTRLSGSGLATPRRAVDTKAFVYTGPGTSSLTFGYNELGEKPRTHIVYRETRTLTIRNTGSSAITYHLTNTWNTDDLGLHVAITPSSVTVPRHGKRDVNVTLTMTEADAAKLPDVAAGHAPDIASDDFAQPYAPLLYAAGAIVASPSGTGPGVYSLRVPWLVAPRGTSGVQDVPATRTPYATQGNLRKSSIKIKNFNIHAGIADVYQWGLQDSDDGLDGIDMRAAGVQTVDPGVCDSGAAASDRCLIFAVNTWNRWSNAAENEFDVLIDTDHDGSPDFAVVGIDLSLIIGALTGIEGSLIVDLNSSSIVSLYFATAPTDGSTVLLPVLASELGLSSGGDQNFEYFAQSFDVYDDDGTLFQFDQMTTGSDPSQASRFAKYNVFHPALSNGQFVSLNPGDQFKLPLLVNHNRYQLRHGMLGWLVVTLEDKNGEFQAEEIPVGRVH